MSVSAASVTSALQGQTDWRQATIKLIEHLVSESECFSSGEIARHLRQAAPKLQFSVPNLGEYVRDLFYQGSMPTYKAMDGYGGHQDVPVSQVSRTTQGLYPMRTRAGVSVFIYAPDQAAGDAHDFEVYIPKPGETDEPLPVTSPMVPASAPVTPGQKAPVVIQGSLRALSPADYKATVNSENRLCVTRPAFEACVHMGGRPMKGGDPVFISFVGDEINISQTPIGAPDEGAYSLATERGRVLFTAQDPSKPFVPGTSYSLKIGPGIIKVSLV